MLDKDFKTGEWSYGLARAIALMEGVRNSRRNILRLWPWLWRCLPSWAVKKKGLAEFKVTKVVDSSFWPLAPIEFLAEAEEVLEENNFTI